MMCEFCGTPMRYLGVGDGYGDYGMSLCDVYICDTCDNEQAVNCSEMGEYSDGDDVQQPENTISLPG